jgi:mRNA-degrading endonuclease YafQ of YafQ-DinJ toxin-antitoxin module
MKYNILPSHTFKKKTAKLIKKDPSLRKKILKVTDQLALDPFHKGLKTHKANTVKYGLKYSSRVTGDLRIVWDFDGEKIILLLTISGHEVYK